MPVRDTFGLVPHGTEWLLYLAFIPFGAYLVAGLVRRYRALGLRREDIPGGLRAGIRRLVVDGLLQRRVSRRPRGWAHIAIFFGFLALFFGTTMVAIDWHFGRLFGHRILAGTFYLIYKAFLDTLGLIFIAGLVAALVRRLRARAADVDAKRRVERQYLWLIGGLLYMAVTGFVLEGLRLVIHPVWWRQWSFVGDIVASALAGMRPIAPTFYVVLWWTHALVAFALIASIPSTIFLHSVAAPLNLLMNDGVPRLALSTPFDLREVMESGNFDVKVGAKSLNAFERVQQIAVEACTNCGRCDSVCPAVATGTPLSPSGLVQMLRATSLDGDEDEDLLAAGKITPEELWACTTCAACVEACPVYIRPVDYIVPFRRELVSQQQVDKRQSELLANLGLANNPYGLPGTRRSELAAELRREEEASD